MSDFMPLIENYIHVWNEPGPRRRALQVAALWSEQGVHFTPSTVARGHAAIVQRITRAHDQWVAEGGCVFVLAGEVDGHHDGVRFPWHMMREEMIVSVGFDFLQLAADGRIGSDHQFILPTPA